MRRISGLDSQGIIDYNLREGGTCVTVFADAQAYRVNKARAFVEQVIGHLGRRCKIIELGCSAGDISGPFAEEHEVIGIDIVPAAAELAKQRYPAMTIRQTVAEAVEPEPCDLLVLCEFLEHLDNPIALVQRWLPLAEFALIGHPLNDPGGLEQGHIWSYELADYRAWFVFGGHREVETHLFSGPFPEMVMGVSQR